ncbi:hypothetical protein KIN20_001896 [Parelaphostrongylus tenuis]|uniref:Uncharacterized protein n=1 Tax=Parelaphostrongylus tenuis TaxID=148309 RepID=A0AAD5QHE1_PARTN|nr:hypothetical protein KIN20_001896 [Parelaphostrongylus tenuis]
MGKNFQMKNENSALPGSRWTQRFEQLPRKATIREGLKQRLPELDAIITFMT